MTFRPTHPLAAYILEDFVPPDQEIMETYDSVTVARIAHDHKIPDKDDLRKYLDEIGTIYMFADDMRMSHRSGQVKRNLQAVQRLTSDLLEALENIDEPTADFLWNPPAGDKGPPDGWEDWRENRFTEKQHIESLEALNDRVEAAILSLPEDRGGRPRAHRGLQLWTHHISHYWQKRLGRPFRIDYHKGAGLTDAFRFCWDALQPLDPKVSERQLVTCMRNTVRRRRGADSQKPPR